MRSKLVDRHLRHCNHPILARERYPAEFIHESRAHSLLPKRSPKLQVPQSVTLPPGGLDPGATSESSSWYVLGFRHPAPLLGLLVLRLCDGLDFQRRLEQAIYTSVAFRFIAANDYADHNTSVTFQRYYT
jgi:hypothetical protein